MHKKIHWLLVLSFWWWALVTWMITKTAKIILSSFVLWTLQWKETMGMPCIKNWRVMIKSCKWIFCWVRLMMLLWWRYKQVPWMNGRMWKNVTMLGLPSKIAQGLANTLNQPNHKFVMCYSKAIVQCCIRSRGVMANHVTVLVNFTLCFYNDAIKVLTKATSKHHEKYLYLKNVQLQKYMYHKYFNREYTYLYKLTGLQKLPCLPLPWCFEAAVKKTFPDKTYKGFIQTRTNQK